MRFVTLTLLLFVLFSTVALAADADKDGIEDTFDGCPETPAGAVIVDPTANVYYAGCTCDQVKEIIDEDNPCLNLFCYREVLEMRNKPYDGLAENCPEDYCDGFTYYDYPLDGFPRCVDMELMPYSCAPVIEEDSVTCGYEPLDENITVGTKPVPTLPEGAQSFLLTNARIVVSLPEDVMQGDKASAEILYLPTDSGTDLQPKLLLGAQELPPLDMGCGEDENATLWCLGKWELSTLVRGEHELTFALSYDPGTGDLISSDISFPFVVHVPPFAPKPAEAPVILPRAENIRPFTPREEFLVQSIHEELYDQGLIGLGREAFFERIAETAKHFTITKDAVYDPVRDVTTFTITIVPNKGIIAENMSVIEYMPKEVAAHVDEVKLFGSPIIVRDDPLIMWHFAAVDERVDLSYEIEGDVTATGNTIISTDALENETSPLFIIIPMLMIPLIILLLIGLPRLVKGHRVKPPRQG